MPGHHAPEVYAPKVHVDVVSMTNPERKRRIDKLLDWIDGEIQTTRKSTMGFKRPCDLSTQFNIGKHIGFFTTREMIAELTGMPKKTYECWYNSTCNFGPCKTTTAYKPIHCLKEPHLMGYCLWNESTDSELND